MRSLVCFVFCVGLVGCALVNMASFEKPVVKLHNVSLTKIDFQTVDLVFTVDVENPNDFDLDLKGLSYEVEMNGNKVATQNVTTPIKVKALKSSKVQLPLSLEYSQIFGSIGGFLKTQKSLYKIKGSAQFGIVTLPFSEKGKIEFQNGKLKDKKI
jgi:LEA14-like dessication related protein